MRSTTKAVDTVPQRNQDCPSAVESEVSSLSSIPEIPTYIETAPRRQPLQWEFKGLTLWLEFEEFDGDLTRANEFLAAKYGTRTVPRAHATAIYGMDHLSEEEAKTRLAKVPLALPDGKWPLMDRPVAVKQDISQEGLPGQVCSISWAELTLKTNSEHEMAMDALCELFDVDREGPWTPHISLAYDNPEDSVLQLADILSCARLMPSMLHNSRRVKAMSLWSTRGKMGDWECLDCVSFMENK
jgi:hypothetical protein